MAVLQAHTSFMRVGHGLSWQWAGSAQLIGANWRLFSLFSCCFLLEPLRGNTGGERGGGKALTEAQPSLQKDELGPGGAVRRFGGACCVQDSVQHHEKPRS